MADLTGSRAFERFTASQILKIAQIAPDAFHHTVRISLVSSFLASLLVGQFASIDIADGSGMNLLNIATKEWDPCLTDFIASARSPQDGPSPPFREVIARCDRRQQKALLKDHQQPLPSQDQTESSRTLQDEPTADVNRLMTLLGSVDVTGTAVQGMVAPWFATKYGFQPTTPVVSFTGDNPATALAMQLHPGDAIVSLGTSDTVMLYTSAANSIHINNNSSSSNITNAPDTMRRLLLLKDLNHNAATSILCHPTDPLGFLTLYCAKNGSLARERVRDEYAGGHWELFDELMVAALERRRQTWGARMHNVAEVAAERTGHGHAGAGAAGDGRPHVDDERTEDHRSCSFDHCKNVDQNDQDKKDHGAEKEKDEEDEGDWVTRFGFYFFEREIWPPVKGVHRFEDGRPVTEFTGKDEAAIRQQNVLAICEAQLLAMRVRAATTNASSLSSSSSPSSSPSFPPTGEGSHGTPRQRSSPMAASTTNTTTAVSRILATGGGSKSKAILQLMANVFNVPVVPMSEDGWAGSAAWGAACKAYLCSEKASHSDDNSKATATATDNSTTVRPTQGDQDKEDTPRIYYPDPVHAAYYAHVTKQFSELEYTLDHLKSLEL
ncbi:hypothetical protein BGZ73_007816 [Actinomortierella ambigua]|nr:hypothetical protein BGZ73_007816 [Actinomortierella ambigua]